MITFVSARHEEWIPRRARRFVNEQPACIKQPRSQGEMAQTDSADMRSSNDSLLISRGHLHGSAASTPRPATVHQPYHSPEPRAAWRSRLSKRERENLRSSTR
jgi:hypothetical protein